MDGGVAPKSLEAVRLAVEAAEAVPPAVDPDCGPPPPDDEGPPWEGERPPPAPLPDGCPVIPLGKHGDNYFYLDACKELRCVKDEKHSRLKLQGLFGAYSDLLESFWPRYGKDGEPVMGAWRPELAAAALMAAAAVKGVWSPADKVRGAGAWLGRHGELILHCGNRIWVGPRPKSGDARGAWREPGELDGLIYPTAPAMARPADEPMPGGARGPAAELLSMIQTWTFRRGETDAVLMLGWIGAAMLGGALKWRPAVWLTGSKHTGKSTLQDLVYHVLGEGGLVASGDATGAGVWQTLGYASLPVALDEAESEEDNRKMQGLIKLARNAANGTLTLRGGSDHTSVSFAARSSFFFSSILTPPLLGQDRSRMAILELGELAAGTKPPAVSAKRLGAIGTALRRRLVDGWGRYAETLEMYRDALAKAGHVSRGADVFGTLLACADLLLHEDLPTSDELADWGDKLRAENLAELDGDMSDQAACLNFLLTTAIDPYRQGGRRTIGDWVKQGAELCGASSGDALDANKALSSFGIKVIKWAERSDEVKRYYLAVANSHQGLAAIFAGSHWAGRSGTMGVWVQAMRRLPGAVAPRQAVWMGAPVKVTILPIELVWPVSEAGASQHDMSPAAGVGRPHEAAGTRQTTLPIDRGEEL